MSAAPLPRPNPLDTALRLLALGFSVIPIKARDKKPAIQSWKEFQTRRPTEAELRAWFADPNLNLAIVTGAISQRVVIDADNPEAVSWMVANHCSPMRTVTSQGRKHFWFAYPGHEVRNGAKLAGMALDIRGDGGYVVAPGSIHSSGAIYTEEGDWTDLEHLPVFQASWLGEKVQPLVHPEDALTQRVRAYLDRIPGEAEGSRDNQGFKVACKLVREFALLEDTALDFLASWNQKNNPPLAEADLRRLVHSAAKSGRAPMGSKLTEDRPDPRGSWRPPMPAAADSVEDGGAGNLDEVLHRNDKDKVIKSAGNLAKILRMDATWGRNLALNEMSQEMIYRGQVVGDPFIDWVQERIEDAWHLTFGREDVASKLLAQASLNQVHPVREHLRGLPAWDGEERLRRVAAEILGDPAPLAYQYIMRTMVGAVRRVHFPGTKVDTVLVLTGEQGIYKSTFFRVLAGEEFFGDSPIDLESKDGPMTLHRSWFNELAEIDHATSTRAAERIKSFLSTSKDIFRPPFAKSVGVFPRSCVIVGTANKDAFLTDPSGSRRFWPIRVQQVINLDLLRTWRDQLWAEAINLFDNGVEHWLPRDLECLRAQDANRFEAEDPWIAQLDTAVEDLARQGRILSDGLTIADLLTQMNVPVQQQTVGSSMKVAGILREKGWNRFLKGPKRLANWAPREPQRKE